MLHYDKTTTSVEIQKLLDSYLIELFEKGERKTVRQIHEELGTATRTIYGYIRYCCGSKYKAKTFSYMMQTINFKPGNNYYEIQQSFLEKLKIERKKKSLMVIKELLARQKIREEQENLSKKLK